MKQKTIGGYNYYKQGEKYYADSVDVFGNICIAEVTENHAYYQTIVSYFQKG